MSVPPQESTPNFTVSNENAFTIQFSNVDVCMHVIPIIPKSYLFSLHYNWLRNDADAYMGQGVCFSLFKKHCLFLKAFVRLYFMKH